MGILADWAEESRLRTAAIVRIRERLTSESAPRLPTRLEIERSIEATVEAIRAEEREKGPPPRAA